MNPDTPSGSIRPDSIALDARRARPTEGGPSFSLGNRIFRAVWQLTWLLLASWTPPPLHGWRRFLLRAFGARIHPTARIYGSTAVWYPPHLEMGKQSVMSWQTQCYCMAKVTLADYANVAQRVHLCAGTHDIDDPDFQLIAKPITVESHAWLAADSFVGPGVTVREGAVLGARGVAFRDLEAWTVYGGNPARVIKMRRRHVRAGSD